MIRVLIVITTIVVAAGCASKSLHLPNQKHTTSVEPFELPSGPEHATGFFKGQFVRDVRPLTPPDTTDLREMALTLPILEDDSDYNTSLIYKNSKAAITTRTWDLPTDGAQPSVRIERLKPAANGAATIMMTMGPSVIDANPSNPTLWVSRLERVSRGWRVLSATTTTYGEQFGAANRSYSRSFQR